MPGHAKAAYWAVGLYRTPRRIVAQLQQTAHGLSLPQKVPGRRSGRGPLTSRRFGLRRPGRVSKGIRVAVDADDPDDDCGEDQEDTKGDEAPRRN